MKKGKMVLAVAAIALALSHTGATAFGQAEEMSGRGPGRPMAGKRQSPPAAERLDRMTKRLDLTQAQQAQIKPILEEEDKQLETLRDQTRAVHQATRDKIKAVLTPAQQKKIDEMRENGRKRFKERRPHSPQANPQ